MRPDQKWFMEIIAQSRFGSLRALAPMMKTRSGRPMNQSGLSRILAGKQVMRLEDAEALSRLLDLPFAVILEHSGLSFVERDPTPAALRPLIALLGKVDPRDRELVRELLERLVSKRR